MENLEDTEGQLYSQSQLGTELDVNYLYKIYKELQNNKFPTTKWFMFGVNLSIEKPTLEKIQHNHEKDLDRCLLECLDCWLKKVDCIDKKGGATWDTLCTALEDIGEKFAALTIRKKVKEEALKKYNQKLSQALVQASQLLYSEKCINEETLDEMENLEGTTEDKKTTLLKAIDESLSPSYEKLGKITSVMSRFKETKYLYEKITAQYAEMDVPPDVQPVVQQTVPHSAGDILQCHYGKLSQFLQDPIKVGKLLTPQVISQETMESIESSGQERTILLKAIRSAVHINKDNLELFVRAVEKVPQNDKLAKDIWKDFRSVFGNNMQSYNREEIQKKLPEDKLVKLQVIPSEICILRSQSEMFTNIRMEFGIAFTNICNIITKSNCLPPFAEVKLLLQNCFPHTFDNCCCISELLDAIRDKCTLINISCIEKVVKVLKIKDAEAHIQTYRETIKEFCKEVSVTLCLREKFGEASLLEYEKITFVLDWDPDEYTLEDIRNILSITFEKELSKKVRIHVVAPDNSITVTCTFPLSLTSFLVAKAKKTVELVKMKGLIQLTIGYYIILEKEHARPAVKTAQYDVMQIPETMEEEIFYGIQATQADHDAASSACVTLLHCLTPPTTEETNNSDIAIPADTDVKTVNVTPTWLYKKLLKESYKVPILPALLISSGLPNSGKSEAVKMLLNLPETPPPGFSHYEHIATGLSPNSSIQAGKVDENSLYYYGFLAGLKKNLISRAKCVAAVTDDYTKNAFNDEMLDSHLLNTLKHLQVIYKPTTEAETASNSLQQIKGLMEGAGLIKVWDLSFNSFVQQFIRCFSGHLYNSYMWLFTDIERDKPQLHMPINKANINTRSSRLEYLVRCSKVICDLNSKRKNACTIFAKCDDEEQHSDIEAMQKEYQSAAPQLGVDDLINEEIIPVNFSKIDRFFLLQQLKQQIIQKPQDIPLSHIFLRGALDLEKSIFMRHDDLKFKAIKCKMDDESFEEFCRYFTSFGSILDVSLINEDCDIVIIKPNEFLLCLEKASSPQNIQNNDSLLKYGIITEKLAFSLFGKEGDMFLKVLDAAHIVINVTGRCSHEYSHCGACYYMPSVRKVKDKTRYNPKAIQLVRSIRYPSINMEVILGKYLLDKIPNAFLQPYEMDNVTRISTLHDNMEAFIEVVYQGGVIELLVESAEHTIALFLVESIIDVCQEITKGVSKRYGQPQYHFAVLCAEEKHDFAYDFSRKRHILPDDEFCDHCQQKHLDKDVALWIEALQKKPIPNELKLDGDLSAKDIKMLATQIATYPEDAVQHFKQELDCTTEPPPKDTLKWCVLSNAITHWMIHSHHKESTKKKMAKILVKLHEKFKKSPDSDKIRFKELARRLDLQTLTKQQIDEVLSTGALALQDKSYDNFIQRDYWNNPNISDSFEGMVTVGKKLCLYSAHTDHELILEECGLRLVIPAQVIMPIESEYEVAVQGLWGAGKFQFPEGSTLISGVCYVSVSNSSKLNKAVTVKLMHCAHLTDERQTQYLSFVRAISGPPFMFEYLKGGSFSSESQCGTIHLKQFSLLAIVLCAVIGVATAAVTGTSTGGAVAVTGGAVAGTSGAVVGTSGAVTGTGDAVTGTGDAVTGTGCAVSGTGGAVTGTDGVVAGSGDAVAGTGGVAAVVAGAIDGRVRASEHDTTTTQVSRPDCFYEKYVFYENIGQSVCMLNVVVIQDNIYSEELMQKKWKNLGKSISPRRFCFVNKLLKLSGFPNEGTFPGWEVTAQFPPPVINKTHADDFSASKSNNPPCIPVLIEADHSTNDRLKCTLNIEGINVISSDDQETVDNNQPQIVISLSPADLKQSSSSTDEVPRGATISTSDILENPQSRDFLRQIASIKNKWREIGIELGLSGGFIQGLKQTPCENMIKLDEVINEWMKKAQPSSPVTWETMINAIEGLIVNEKKTADEIRDYLTKLKRT